MEAHSPQFNIDCVIGTRPEAVKMAPVVRALRRMSSERVHVRVVSTGQHEGLLDDVLTHFGTPADVNLRAMRRGQSLSSLAARLLSRLDRLWSRGACNLVLAQGDTTSVVAAALAAFHRGIPFGHVEAGLRSGCVDSPFPEEMNRRLAGRMAALHFAPTEAAAANLRRECVAEVSIHVTGNPVIDALQWTLSRRPQPPFDSPAGQRPILVTAHRRENHGSRLREICAAVRELAGRRDVVVVWPVHPNPQVGEKVQAALWDCENVRLLDTCPYPDFVALLQAAHLVLTDSGGLQEEAPALGKPVLVLRDETERPEAVACGAAKLVGAERRRIIETATRLLDDAKAYAHMAQIRFPFGDGGAAARIAAAVGTWISDRARGLAQAGKRSRHVFSAASSAPTG